MHDIDFGPIMRCGKFEILCIKMSLQIALSFSDMTKAINKINVGLFGMCVHNISVCIDGLYFVHNERISLAYKLNIDYSCLSVCSLCIYRHKSFLHACAYLSVYSVICNYINPLNKASIQPYVSNL